MSQGEGTHTEQGDGSSVDEILRAFINTENRQAPTAGVSEEKESATYRKVFEESEGQRQRHREIVTPALRNIAQMWIIAVILLLIWQGFGSRIGFFHLSDKVLITLLVTTTTNVLGLFYLAIKYLYANPDFKPPKRPGDRG